MILLGVRVGLFTPDKAFDVVTKSRIQGLKVPCMKLIELVSEELKQAVAPSFLKVLHTTHKISYYAKFGSLCPRDQFRCSMFTNCFRGFRMMSVPLCISTFSHFR